MKKRVFLSLVLVLHLISTANATVIDVVTDGIGDKGHKGTIDDPLEVGENIDIKIFLNLNPYPGFSSYDGYLLSEMDVSLHISGPGSLGGDKPGGKVPKPVTSNPGFSSFSYSGVGEDGNIDYITGTSSSYIDGSEGSPTKLVWNLYVTAEGLGQVNVDLSLNPGTTKYSPYKTPAGAPYPGGWIDATNSDLGDLTIYAVPEPATIALLGLAGLTLLKKRRP